MADQEQPFSKWGRASSMVTFLLAFGTLAGVFLYAFAKSANDAYMAHLGLNTTFFSHDRDLRMFLGYTLVLKYVLLGFYKLFWPTMVFSVVMAVATALNESLRQRSEGKTFLQWIRSKLKPLISEQATTKQRLFFCVSFGSSPPVPASDLRLFSFHPVGARDDGAEIRERGSKGKTSNAGKTWR